MRTHAAIAAVALALGWVASAPAQTDERERSVVTSELAEPPEPKDRASPTHINLEAYREVLASGRYVVGPGDRFLVHVPGMEQPVEAPVMAEGGVFVPGVGTVPVGGTSLAEARARVQAAFRRSFRSGDVELELVALRSFPVAVVGAVGSPGVVLSSAVERVSEAIRKAGNLGANASRRRIRLVRTGRLDAARWQRLAQCAALADSLDRAGVAERVDLELFNVTGDSRYNPFVEDGDRVIVPARLAEVAARGGVNREGFFEFVPGDRVSDLLALCLGLAPGHDPGRTVVFRLLGSGRARQSIPVDLAAIAAGDSTADLALEPEDWLVVREQADRANTSAVRVTGQVVSPGYYVVEKGRTRLRDVIEWAGGITEDASLWKARVYRAADPDLTPGGRLEAPLDPEFERIKTIPVSERTREEDQYFVMKSREVPGQMVVDFVALFEEGDETQNILLMPGDLIVIPHTQRTVIVSGQAAYPGALTHRPGLRVRDYVELAGGLGWRASKDIRVIKARTGEIKRASDAVQVDPGDRIWIKEKPERDYWAIFRDTMGVLGELSTVVLVYVSFANK